MKKTTTTQSLGLAMAAAVAVVLAPASGLAQSSTPESSAAQATPIPIRIDAPAPTATPASNTAAPASAQALNWIPSSGSLAVNGSQVTVRASSTIPLDTTYHKFVLADANGNFSTAQDASATYTNGDQSVTLIATLPAGNWTRIVFQVKDTSSSAVIESATYTIGRLTYLPMLMKDYFYPPLSLDVTEPNNSPCSAAGALISGKTYNGSFGGLDLDDWYYTIVTQGSNLQLTVSGLSAPNQMQIYYVPSGDCSQISGSPNQKTDNLNNPSLNLSNLPAGRIYIRFAGVSGSTAAGLFQMRLDANVTTGTFEDNDNPCQAKLLSQNLAYTTFADDTYDFFRMDVPADGVISVNVTGYPVADQLQLRRGNLTTCEPANAADRLTFEPIVSGNAVVWQKVTAGTYFARMGPTAAPNNGAYQVAWRVLSSWNPDFDICQTFDACNSKQPGNSVTAYWTGMATSSSFVFRLEGRGPNGGCAKGSSSSTQTPTVTANGNVTFSNLNNGYYALVADIRGPNGEKYQDEKPVKIGCDFIAAASDNPFEPQPLIGPTPAP